ncbi:unnamed protein product [Brachionus calyciflorus]|uniref:phosphopyruvate hydratase n=1 Tax=Brachionus calyciflorus TaxID=104777 RepID=A0A814FN26_9BILA|nr:unnamed protein product [Brachionus calyciflorus]
MPIPMITVIQNGKGFSGKQSLVKEFILLPKPHLSFQEGIDLISRVNRNIRDTLYQSKTNPGAANKCITDIGSYTCSLETPQQALELIENAIVTSLGNEMASNLSIALNIAANEIYDHEKNKYESATGALKSSDELIDQFADLISKFPRIMMLIEPFINSDQIAWYRLNLRISKFCLLANNLRLSDISSHENKNSETSENNDVISPIDNKIPDILKPSSSLIMPVNFYKFENATNVTHIGGLLSDINEKKLFSGLSCSLNETDDDFLADLAVGNQVKFLKIGGFNRSERVNKINRLIDIEYYLSDNKKLLDPKSEQRDINFSPEIEIPADISETISNYEDPKNAKIGKK